MSSLSTVLWTKYLKVTAHGVDPVKCGRCSGQRGFKSLRVYEPGNEGSVLAALGLLPWPGSMTAPTPAGTLNLPELWDH